MRSSLSSTSSKETTNDTVASRKTSLYVISNRRRRASSSGNSKNKKISHSIITFEAKNPLLVDVRKTTIKKDSNPFSVSTASVQIPVASKIAAAVQPLADLNREEICSLDWAVGAASASTLFRARKDKLNAFYPSPSVIRKRTIAGERKKDSPRPVSTQVKTVAELDRFWPECPDEVGSNEECPLPVNDADETIDYNQLLKNISVVGDTQIIGSKDHPDFVHPVLQLMYERKRRQDQEHGSSGRNKRSSYRHKKKEKIALVVEGGGMRGSVSAGMICAIHCLGLADTIDVVYGSSAGAVVSAFFVSKQLPYFGPEVYYDALTTILPNQEDELDNKYHVVDRYDNDYFIDQKRMTRSIGLGLCDPRLLKDVWTRPLHGKPMMNLHYMFENIMQNQKPIDYKTFIERQKIQPLKVVATGLVSEKPVVLSHEEGHFDTLEDLCHSLHASCLLPGIAGPVMNVLKNQNESVDKPKFFLRNMQKTSKSSNNDYEPLADAMLSAPIPYDIAHEDGATHVLVIRSSPDGTNLLQIPSIVAWMGSRIYKRFFLRKNHLPGMYKRSQIEQRHQRIYANAILELNERTNNPRHDQDQTMTIALGPGSDEVSHLETTREGIFRGVRLGFARAYDALVEDPKLRGKGKEMALRFFPDEILDYDPNLYSSPSRSAFEEYLDSTGTIPKTWETEQGAPIM
eukprot:jgi/Psemu1/200400/e_gw1.257.23.1